MKNIKFLHCADLHLDLSFTGSLSAERGKALMRREEIKECFEKICGIAKHHNVDFVIIAGDFYEHSYIRKSTIDFIIEKLRDLFPIQVFICPGNHDPFVVGCVYEQLNKIKNVHVFKEAEKVNIADLNLMMYGEGFVDFYKESSLLTDFDKIDENTINVLTLHGTINGDISNSRYNPLNEKFLNELKMDYIALGHFHGRMMELEKNGMIFNPGSPEALGFDEVGQHGVYIVEIEKINRVSKRKVTFLNTGKREYKEISVDITGVVEDDELVESIYGKVLDGADEKDFIKIILKGFLSKSVKINENKIKSKLKNYFYIKIENLTLLETGTDEVEKGTLKGEFTTKMIKLIDRSENERERKNLIDALKIGLEVIETGELDVEKYLTLD